MATYAAKTEVGADKSRAEIERILARYGARRFAYGWDEDQGVAVLSFQFSTRHIRLRMTLPKRDDPAFTEYKLGSVTYLRTATAAVKLWEQATRQKWRALALVIKAKLEAVESGISTIEDEWLAWTVLPNGTTAGEWLQPQVDEAYRTGEMPALMAGLETRKALVAGK